MVLWVGVVDTCLHVCMYGMRALFQEHNKLEVLPSRFWQMYSLVQLWLGHNCLPSLPDTFGSLTSLALLHVEANQLKVCGGGRKGVWVEEGGRQGGREEEREGMLRVGAQQGWGRWGER
jgi:hypothetical protein